MAWDGTLESMEGIFALLLLNEWHTMKMSDFVSSMVYQFEDGILLSILILYTVTYFTMML